MTKNLLLIIFLTISVVASAQKYSRVEIEITPNQYKKLAQLAIPLDNAQFNKTNIIVELSSEDIQKIVENGFKVKILIDDMESYYQKMLASPKQIVRTNTTPQHFHLGSMGGNLTYAECLAELDSMHALYPNLITSKVPINDTLPTHNDSLIYWVKISDNPNIDEDEPEVLYTGLHHAREPVSMMHLIYYMWYLLENYGTDEYTTYLVDNFEQYFVPVVNVDGYLYNQQTDPNGGGMWRKNRRNNGDGTYGVDINRNYPFMWGYDDEGSSPNTSDETYRGPAPASEPSVQNIIQFSQQHHFLIANNNHTYSNLLLYPYSYSDTATNPDLQTFIEYAKIMTRQNHFTFGRPWEILYSTNGDSNDWMYHDLGIIAYTAETGSIDDGFWPSQDRIIPLCENNLYMNEMMCTLAGAYAEARDRTSQTIPLIGYFDYKMYFLGLDTSATFKVYLSGDDVIYSDTVSYTNYSVLQTIPDSLFYQLNDNIQYGSQVGLVVVVDNGKIAFRDTIYKIVSKIETVFYDSLETSSNWTGNWSLTAEAYHSPTHSMTDSPNGDYANDANTYVETINSFDLSQYSSAFVEFYAKWNIEDNWDATQFLISTDNGSNWTPLASQGTNLGSGQGVQTDGEPVFDGVQDNWTLQSVDLSNYLSQNMKFKFTLQSDGSVTNDGFYFDDFVIKAIIDDIAPVIVSQNPVNVHSGVAYQLKYDDLNVTDEDDDYPNGFYIIALPGNNYTVEGMNTIVPDNGYTGTLTVPVKVCDGYKMSNVFNMTLNSTLDLKENLHKNVIIYPNPASDFIQIISNEVINRIEIYNAKGNKVKSSENSSIINISALPQGVYYLKVYSNKSVLFKKLVIE